MRSKTGLLLAILVVAFTGSTVVIASNSRADSKEWVEIDAPAGYAIACPALKTCFLTGQGEIHSTRDGGRTWHTSKQTIDYDDGSYIIKPIYHRISFPNENTGYVLGKAFPSTHGFAGVRDMLLATNDGGETWTARQGVGSEEGAVGTQGYFSVIEFPSVNHGIIGGHGPSYPGLPPVFSTTEDGGLSWKTNMPFDPGRPALEFLQVGDLACPTVQRCYLSAMSRDGLNEGLFGGGRSEMFTTSDGGSTWLPLKWNREMELTYVFPMALSCPQPQVCYGITGGDGIIKTSNGGEDWRWVRFASEGVPTGVQQSGRFTLEDIACPRVDECHAVGLNGAVLGTTNGGDSWQVEVPQGNDSFAHLLSISCPSPDVCYAGGNATYVLRYGDPYGGPGPVGSPRESLGSNPPSSPTPILTTEPSASSSGGPVTSPRSVSLSASANRAVAGSSIHLSGELHSDLASCEGPGKPVDISQRIWGTDSYRRVASASTDAMGLFELTLPAESSSDFLAAVAADPGCTAATSSPVSVEVAVVVKAKASEKSVDHGSRFSISGSVVPNHPGTKAGLQRKSGNRWVGVAVKTLPANSRFRFPMDVTWKGVAFFRVVWLGGDEDHAGGKSRPIKVSSR